MIERIRALRGIERPINIRPRQGNRGLEVENPELRERMRSIVLRKVPL